MKLLLKITLACLTLTVSVTSIAAMADAPFHFAAGKLTLYKVVEAPGPNGVQDAKTLKVCSTDFQIPVYDYRTPTQNPAHDPSPQFYSCSTPTTLGGQEVKILTECRVLSYSAPATNGSGDTAFRSFSCDSKADSTSLAIQDIFAVQGSLRTQDMSLADVALFYDSTRLRTGPQSSEHYMFEVDIKNNDPRF